VKQTTVGVLHANYWGVVAEWTPGPNYWGGGRVHRTPQSRRLWIESVTCL